jgi:hypothetical protein
MTDFPAARFLKEYEFWEYFPMDQGGRFVQLQLVGSEKDADMVAVARRPDFFCDCRPDEIEKSVWFSRWYCLPSFARLHWLTGEQSYLDDLLRIFRRPIPGDLHARDMQLAWRTLNLVWCYRLSGVEELRPAIESHAQKLTAEFSRQPLHAGNHQSHAALAMLLAARALNGDPSPALRILDHHCDAAFFADGNSIELSPGYYPFVAAIFREAYLLAPVERWRDRLVKCYRFLRAIQQPDGTTPPINDSSEVPVGPSLRILEDVLGNTGDEPVNFGDSNQAVLRDERSYVFLDAGESHWRAHLHSGRLGFHYWRDGQPRLVDSGCCNYDEPLRKQWYLTAAAHNTVLMDGAPADAGSRIVELSPTRATMRSDAGWTRSIALGGAGLELVDTLAGDAEREYTWLFHFAEKPTPIVCEPKLRMELIEGYVNKNGRNLRAPVARFTARAKRITVRFWL